MLQISALYKFITPKWFQNIVTGSTHDMILNDPKLYFSLQNTLSQTHSFIKKPNFQAVFTWNDVQTVHTDK
jgi:hypothetical protein